MVNKVSKAKQQPVEEGKGWFDKQQAREWAFTASAKVWGTPEEFKEYLLNTPYDFVFQEEEGAETGYRHYQGYLTLPANTPIKGSTIAKILPNTHLSARKSKLLALYQYCTKQETRVSGPYFSDGYVPPADNSQAKQDKLEALVAKVQAGVPLSSIYLNDTFSSNAVNYLERVSAASMKERGKKRRQLTEVVWLYGPTRTGKTTYVMEKFDIDDVYRVSDYSNPWDSYEGQSILILDEYIAQFTVTEFNNLLDSWPKELRARYANKWALWNKVYVVSNFSFEQAFSEIKHTSPGAYDAAYARFTSFAFKLFGEVFVVYFDR